MSNLNFTPIPGGLVRDLFPEPPKPPCEHDPRFQAFLEDLAAVYVKHGLVYGQNCLVVDIEQGRGYHTAVYIDDCEELRTMDQAEMDEYTAEPDRFRAQAFVPLPTTAHARLAAAARVACLAGQEGQIAETVERIAEMLDRAAEPGEYGCVSDDMPLEGLVGTIGSPCSHAEFRDLMRPIIQAFGARGQDEVAP